MNPLKTSNRCKPALSRMACILTSLGDDMLAISEVVSEIAVHRPDPLTPQQVLQLQRIDRVTQCLNDLAVICNVLAVSPNDADSKGIPLQLAEMQSILDPQAFDEPQTKPGSVELF